ncbi:MAG: RpiR family transcriptional regulator, carbohydrate utilization regulator [Actinomycetota bacterium]|jgi:RpiR family carbohydrate utilization transcriptional regulator|nr:RpiR family transcriptional regulator, carbohydrate utilization regulator [Actinomycetota bacterium]
MNLASFGFPGEAALRPSERKVAEILIADPAWFSRATLSEIAARAEVSEPTVIRFTRSLGCRGFQDFKYTLIQSLASPLVGVHSLIDESDPLPTVITKTLDASITALTSLRDSLNVETFGLVADAIATASDLVVLGFGASGIVGQDLAQKFPLLGLPINAPADAHQQFMAATLAGPTTAVMAISNTAATIEVLNSAREAKSRGATIIALSGREGPLTEIADLVLLAGGEEDTNEYTPTSSRLAHLAVVDALSVVVALRRGRAANKDLRRMKRRLNVMRTSGQPVSEDATLT